MADNESPGQGAQQQSAPDPDLKLPSKPLSGPDTAGGPLVVSQVNPRYFTVASGDGAGRAVYLAGSHIWNNVHDGMGPGSDCAEAPEEFDYDAYLACA